MSKTERAKGRRGQAEFKNILRDRDWVVHELNAGEQVADLLATDPAGKTWCVEVKNQKIIALPAFIKQAREQAARAKLPWLLACRLDRIGGWLVARQGERPVVWGNDGESAFC